MKPSPRAACLALQAVSRCDTSATAQQMNAKQIRGADFRCKILAKRDAQKAARQSGDNTASCPALPDHDCLAHLERFALGATARRSANLQALPPPVLPDELEDKPAISPVPPNVLEDKPAKGCPAEASAAQTLANSVRHRLLALRHLQADELLSGEEASQIAVNIVTSLFTQPDQPTQQNTPRTESAQRSMAMGTVRTNTKAPVSD